MERQGKALIKGLAGLGLAAAILVGGSAMAETVGLGSTVRGGTSQIGKAIAAAVSGNSELQMRPQEMANTAEYRRARVRHRQRGADLVRL